MEKLLQVAELGGSNGQRNFSCMDGNPPDIGKCADSCTLLSLRHGWNDLKKPTRGMSILLFWSRDSLAEWSHGKDMAICTFSGSKIMFRSRFCLDPRDPPPAPAQLPADSYLQNRVEKLVE
jgi:hypothetical protein